MLKMKFLLILLLFTLEQGFSQKFHGGLLLGGDVSQVAGDTLTGYDKLGFLGGVYSSLDISEHFSFQIEMDYIQKGSRRNADVANQNYNSYLLRLSYFEVPLVFQYTFLRIVQVEAGPAMDVLISSYEETQGLEVQNTVPLRPVTLSGILGASCYFWKDRMKVNFRWNTSILSIRQPVSNTPEGYVFRFGQWGQFNDVLALSLYYKFK